MASLASDRLRWLQHLQDLQQQVGRLTSGPSVQSSVASATTLDDVHRRLSDANALLRPEALRSMEAEEFMCPLMHVPMLYPVTAADGETYERDAILIWMQQHASQIRLPGGSLPIMVRGQRQMMHSQHY